MKLTHSSGSAAPARRPPLGPALITTLLVALLAACGGAATQPPAGQAGTTADEPVVPAPEGATADADVGLNPTTAMSADEPVVTAPEGATADADIGLNPTTAPTAAAGAALDPGDDRAEVAIAELIADPDQYAGERVGVRGRLGEVLGPRSFVVAEAEDGSAPRLLVIGGAPGVMPPELGVGINPDVDVQVTGEVRPFNLPAFEVDLNADFPDDLVAAYEGRNVIVADRILIIDDGAAAQESPVSVAAIAADPGMYRNQTVTVTGGVGSIIGPGSFTLQDPQQGEEMVLVFIQDQAVTVTGQDRLTVTGAVRELSQAEAEREVGYELGDQLFAESGSRPVIIAETVSEMES